MAVIRKVIKSKVVEHRAVEGSAQVHQAMAPYRFTLLKKFKGAHTLWQIKTDIPSFDTKIQKN